MKSLETIHKDADNFWLHLLTDYVERCNHLLQIVVFVFNKR